MTGSLFDGAEGARLRDAAIAQVDEHAPIAFKVAALDAVHRLAVERPELAADDVWEELHKVNVADTREPRALGSIMRQAAAQGWVERTDRVRPSMLPRQHRRHLAIWRSKIHG